MTMDEVYMLSNGLRLEDLRLLLDLTRRDAFRTRSYLGAGRRFAFSQVEMLERVDMLGGVESRILSEIEWLEATSVPADRIREQFPRLLAALRRTAAYLARLPQHPDRGFDVAALTMECKSVLALIDAANQPQA